MLYFHTLKQQGLNFQLLLKAPIKARILNCLFIPCCTQEKFWLKTLVFSIAVLLCLRGGIECLNVRIFNTENIDAFIQKNFSAHGCQIKYNATIGRKWLPRPTLILKDLSLSSSEPDTPTLNIAESKMGFGWSSLWSDAPILEKWILLNPTLTLDSKHHLPTCLQQDPSSKESFQLNRIIINSGSIPLSQ